MDLLKIHKYSYKNLTNKQNVVTIINIKVVIVIKCRISPIWPAGVFDVVSPPTFMHSVSLKGGQL